LPHATPDETHNSQIGRRRYGRLAERICLCFLLLSELGGQINDRLLPDVWMSFVTIL